MSAASRWPTGVELESSATGQADFRLSNKRSTKTVDTNRLDRLAKVPSNSTKQSNEFSSVLDSFSQSLSLFEADTHLLGHLGASRAAVL